MLNGEQKGLDLKKSVEPIIRQAGSLLLSYYHKKLTWQEKKEHGFVTEADLACEEFLIRELSRVLPQASFFAEESGKQGAESEFCWVIDPLDGTTNFAYGIPYFCISVSLTRHDEPFFGMIYEPLLKQLFYAERNKGAYLNDMPIKVTQKRPLEKSLILVGFPYAKGEAFMQVLNNLEAVSPHSYAFRHMGAIALDQALIACGRADGIFFENLTWWDVAAGMLLITEAGGKVTTYQGESITPAYSSYLSAHPTLHKRLLDFINN